MNMERRVVPHLEEGTIFGGRYRIVSPIGRGGMGRVYLAEDLRLNGRKRALKITASPDEEREQFIREAEWLTRLKHPHLPEIVDYFPPDADGWAVIVMDYVSGDTLEGIFSRCGYRLPFPRVLRYAGQICGLLCYLHGREPPVVFRDLKPSNVIIDPHDRAILVDFGIARAFRPDALSDTVRLGTPAFAAPEQLKGLQTDHRSDLYSLGALLYYLLTGGRNAAGRRGNLRKTLQDDVPAPFALLLEQLLSDDPSDRPQSAAELMQRLQQIPLPPNSVIHAEFPRADKEDGVTIAAIMSAYPGAGATLAALGLSKYLCKAGIHHALVEMPGGDAELYGLLDGPRRMPRSAAFADPSGSGETTPAWKDRTALYYPVSPHSSMPPEEGFFAWLRRFGVPVVLLDVSGRWENPGMWQMLTESGIASFWWVADCLPSKWTLRRQAAAEQLTKAAVSRGAYVGWIASKDHAFSGRSQWLAGFPSVPVAKLPLLPAEKIVESAWKGNGYPDDSVKSAIFERAFQPWARRIVSMLEK
jgi:serine/threonine-protein kinase